MASIEKLTNFAKEHLDPCEEILAVVKGTYAGEMCGRAIARSGILLATDMNVVLYGKRWTGFDLKFFPYDTISSIEIRKGFGSIYRVSFRVYFDIIYMSNIRADSWSDHGDVKHFVEIVKRMIMGDSPVKSPIGF